MFRRIVLVQIDRNDAGAALSAGVYFYTIRADLARVSGKVLLIH